MDVRHLHYLTEVAKHKNFTRASEALHISQPSLSKMVKSLEEANYDGWITVELDSYLDPKQGAKISRSYLNQFDKVNQA